MVDIHSHFLPGIDDGAKNWDVALSMVRMAAEDGITHIVATPHCNDEYNYDRAASLELLKKLREQCGVTMDFSLGCDFHFSIENIEAALERPERFCIGNTDYLLIEFSDFAISPFTGDALLRFIRAGVTPIITHPERNAVLQRRPQSIRDFAANGCVIQVTANSVTGYWGERPRKLAEYLLDHACVHVIASDAHDLSRRPPVLSKAHRAIGEKYGHEIAQALCQDNPRAIVNNRALPYFPEPRAQ